MDTNAFLSDWPVAGFVRWHISAMLEVVGMLPILVKIACNLCHSV